MNLQQIEAVCEVAANNFNISAAAKSLRRSQPTLSRQVRELEDALGVRIFTRTRNKVIALTPKGKEVVRIGQRITRDSLSLSRIGDSDVDQGPNELKIATTHLLARYLLPQVIKKFSARYPAATLTLQQGDPAQCCELIATGKADIAVTTAESAPESEVVSIPAFRLARCVIAPRGHPILKAKKLTLRVLAKYPIVAYSTQFSGRWIVDDTFARAGLHPHIACSAIDADVGKTYVELGMGIAVLARIAIDPGRDSGLGIANAGHLFPPTTVNMVLRKHDFLRRNAREFLAMLAPHIGADLIRNSMEGHEIDRTSLRRLAPCG